MPFKLIKRGRKKGEFKSPSGRIFSKRQVKAYYWTGGFKNKTKLKKLRRI